MDVEHLDVVLDAKLGRLARALAQADVLADRTEKNLARVKITDGQAAESAAALKAISSAIGGIPTKAVEASEQLGRVKLATDQAVESAAAADVIDRKLKMLRDDAFMAERGLGDVKITETQATESEIAGGRIERALNRISRAEVKARLSGGRNGVGVGPFGSGFGRIGVLGTAIGAGAVTAPAAGPAAVGLLAAVPTLAAGGVGALGTLMLAFSGVGKAIGGDKKAFDDLTRSQKQFVLTVRSLDGWLDRLKQTAAGAMFPGLTAGLKAALSPQALTGVATAVNEFGHAIGQAGEQWGKYFGSAKFQSLFGPLMAAGAQGFTVMSKAAMSLFDALAVLGRAAIPFATWLQTSAAAGAAWVDRFLRAKDASGQLAGALGEARTSLTLVARLAGALVKAVVALGAALYPVAKVAVRDLTGGLSALAGWLERNRKTIQQLVGGALNAFVQIVRAGAGAVGVFAGGIKAAADLIDRFAGPVVTARNAVAELAGVFVAVKVGSILAGWAGGLVNVGRQAVLTSRIAEGATEADAATYVGSMGVMEAATIGLAATIKSALISTGIGALVVAAGIAAVEIIQHWETVKRWMIGFGRFLPGLFSAAWTAIKGIFQLGVYALMVQFEALARVAAKAFGWIPGIGGRIKAALNAASSFIEGFRERGVADMQKAGAQMGDAWGNAFGQSVQDAIDKINAKGVMKTVPMEGTLFGTHVYKGTPKANEPKPGTHAWYLKYLGYDPTTSLGAPLGKQPAFTSDLGPKKAFSPLPSALAAQLANAQAAAQGGGLKELRQLEQVEKRALAYLNQEHATGKNLVAVAKERLAVTRLLAQTEKQLAQKQTGLREERILGLAPGGGQTTPGAVALRQREHKILESSLAQAFGGKSHQIAVAAQNIGVPVVSLLHKTNEQLIAEMRRLGVALPRTALESLNKINAVLKNKFIPPDVRDNIRARLAQIEETLKASSKQLATNYRPVHSTDIVKGLGLDRAQKLAVEGRVAQALAHGGAAPTAGAAAGIPLATGAGFGAGSVSYLTYGDVIIKIDGGGKSAKEIAAEVRTELIKHGSRNGGRSRTVH